MCKPQNGKKVAGVKIRPNTAIGTALEIKDLFRDGYESIFIGTGVWRPKTLGVKGESSVVEATSYSKVVATAMDNYMQHKQSEY